MDFLPCFSAWMGASGTHVRHHIITEELFSPSFSTSSQPIKVFPFLLKYFSISRINHACNSSSFFSCSFFIRFWQSAQPFQLCLSTSSPPIWTYFDGKRSKTSAYTLLQNSITASFPGQSGDENTLPHPYLPSQTNPLYASIAAMECPGISISGIISMPMFLAYATTSRMSACV